MRNEEAEGKTFRVMAGTLALLTLGLVTGCERPTISEEKLFPPVEDQPVEGELIGEPDPIASEQAVRGGIFTTWGSGFPKSLNVWLDPNAFSGQVMGLMYESLAGLHPTEERWIGNLAESWEEIEPGMEYKFKLRPQARWSDGHAITAEDVLFYYDTIMDENNLTTVARAALSRLERPQIIDELTFTVRGKKQHWINFVEAAGMLAFPKHKWEGKDFNKINFLDIKRKSEPPIVSGPYELIEVDRPGHILLQRRNDWWGRILKRNQYVYNFDYLRFRFSEDRDRTLDRFLAGEYDMYPIYTARIWAERTTEKQLEQVKKNWVIRQEIMNQEPLGFQGLYMNMRRPLFQDKNVREALSYLLDRDYLDDKIMYNQYIFPNSYYPDLWDDKSNPNATRYTYKKEKARQLLKDSGWTVNQQGILEKDGQPLKFEIIYRGTALPHFDVYQESLKDVGIEVSLQLLENASWAQRMEKYNFDMTWIAMGAGRTRDPEPIWKSDLADQEASLNWAGVKDEKIDELIQQQTTEMDLAKRNEILQEIDTRLLDIVPTVLLWNSDRNRLLYWNRFGTPDTVLDKFNREDVAAIYWWEDREKKAALDEAKTKGASLPAEPELVRFSEES